MVLLGLRACVMGLLGAFPSNLTLGEKANKCISLKWQTIPLLVQKTEKSLYRVLTHWSVLLKGMTHYMLATLKAKAAFISWHELHKVLLMHHCNALFLKYLCQHMKSSHHRSMFSKYGCFCCNNWLIYSSDISTLLQTQHAEVYFWLLCEEYSSYVFFYI